MSKGGGKRPVMTDMELDAMNGEVIETRLYDKSASNGEKVSGIVLEIGRQIQEAPEKITLRDVDAVKEVTKRYIDSCYRTGVLPSKQGLGRACGMSRQSLDDWCRRNPDSRTAEFLALVFDGFSEMMSMASLTGTIQPIVSIFLQKALYGVRENEPLPELAEPDPLEYIDETEIARRLESDLSYDFVEDGGYVG